ncbi:MAG: aldo/keto reductase [Myxococcales bacterium]|nr:aldo/keto reductase [Myxococcales bacterium]
MAVGSSYGVGARAIEAAFDRGVNFILWGLLRRERVAVAIRHLARRDRDRLVVGVQSYSPFASPISMSLKWALWRLGLDRADVLMLGKWNRAPPRRIVDEALRLRERGLCRALSVSTHKRTLVPELAAMNAFDLIMVRYNAVHRGAEREVFPLVPKDNPRLMAFTATRWGALVDPRRTPAGERTPQASDCYRFVLTHPRVDLALCGPGNDAQMEEALRAMERGPMSEEELAWMRRVGDAIYEKRGVRRGDAERKSAT